MIARVWGSAGRGFRRRLAALALAAATTALVAAAAARGEAALAGGGAVSASANLLASPFAAADTPTPYREGVVILGFHPRVSIAREQAIERSVNASGVEQLGPTVQPVREHGVLRVAPTPLLLYVPGADVLAISSRLAALGAVAYAEPDYLLSASATPNDPSFALQWGDSNVGQSIPTQSGNEEQKLGPPVNGTPAADDRAAKAWNVTTGSSSIVIGEADTGIEYTHADLAANVWSNPAKVGGCATGTHGYNVLTKTCEPMDNDTQYGGHGTHVAGIMGAVGNNRIGVAGMNWQTSLLPVKWLNSKASGETSGLIAALQWLVAAKQEGVNLRVVNDSATFKGTSFSLALSEEIDTLGANNILFVTAAGNTSEDDDLEGSRRYPCDYDRPTELCVTATNNRDQLAPWANYGPNTVQLGAPGESIYSTLRQGKYGYLSGGSMASAQVSGAAALILSVKPALSATQVRADILESVDKLSSLEGKVITAGRLDVCRAIPSCLPPVNSAPPTIGGTAQQEKTLTEAHGEWTNSPSGYAIEWQRCESSGSGCSTISAAANKQEYTLEAADVGKKIKVLETASNAGGPAEKAAESTLVGPVTQAAPVLVAGKPPTLSGEAKQEKTLTEAHGEWTNSPSGYAIEWQRCESSGSGCSTISAAANKQEYTLEAADVGKKIKVLETASNAGGPAEKAAESTLVGPVTQAAPVLVAGKPPTLSGEAKQEKTLTEAHGEWTNSPSGYAIEWQRCESSGSGCSTISAAANKQEYTLEAADVGKKIKVLETASNAGGPAEKAAESTLVGPVTQAAPVLVAGKPPTLSGEAKQEKTLTEAHGEWTNSPSGYAIEWQRCESSGSGCSTISAAANKQEYTLEAADVGKKIKVLETASNAGGPAEKAAESTLVGPVTQAAPVLVAGKPPTLSGEAKQEKTLTEAHGEWTNSPSGYAIEWQRCESSGSGCSTISAAANKQEYTLEAADVGKKIKVLETASNAGGPAEKAAESTLVGPVSQAAPVLVAGKPPTLSGEAKQEKTLTEAHGEWTNSPSEFKYQWLQCDSEGTPASCQPIAGAGNQTYEAQGADVGHALRVQETAVNAGGASAPATSEATQPVAPSFATFGKSSVGASASRVVANRKTVTRYQLPRPGTVTQLTVYLQPTGRSGQQQLTGVIYAGGENAPSGLLATSRLFSFSRSNPSGWYDLAFAAPPSLAAGGYWIGVLAGSASKVAAYRYDPVARSGAFNTDPFTSGPSNPFGRARSNSVQMSIFATYTHE